MFHAISVLRIRYWYGNTASVLNYWYISFWHHWRRSFTTPAKQWIFFQCLQTKMLSSLPKLRVLYPQACRFSGIGCVSLCSDCESYFQSRCWRGEQTLRCLYQPTFDVLIFLLLKTLILSVENVRRGHRGNEFPILNSKVDSTFFEVL